MSSSLFKLTGVGKCENCKEDNVPLEEVVFRGKRVAWCDACVEGLRLEKEAADNLALDKN